MNIRQRKKMWKRAEYISKLINDMSWVAKRKLDLEEIHWIMDAEMDEVDYCEACGEKKLEKVVEKYPEATLTWDMSGSMQADSPARCETCGKLLYCTYTDYCIEEEWEYLKRYKVDIGDWEEIWSLTEIVNWIDSERYARLKLSKKLIREYKELHTTENLNTLKFSAAQTAE